MQTKQVTITRNNQTYDILLDTFDKNDLPTLQQIYTDWINLSNNLREINGRSINLPEVLSEALFCIHHKNSVGIATKGTKLQNESSAFNCYDLTENKTIQLKARSVTPDLSSFSPRGKFQELYFMDFSRKDGTFDVYDIPLEILYETYVSKSQTFSEQLRERKRPRLSLHKMAQNNKLKPITHNI